MYCPDTDRHTSIGNILRERAPETQTNGVTSHRWILDNRRKRGHPLHHGMLQAVEGAPGSAMPAGRREPAEPADAQSKAVRREPRPGPNRLILNGLLRQELITRPTLSPPIVQPGRWVYTTSQDDCFTRRIPGSLRRGSSRPRLRYLSSISGLGALARLCLREVL